MAVEQSQMFCSNSMHLCDNEKKSKESDDRGKDSAIQWPGSSRVEKLCKALAFLIVFCLFCVHLVRVLREGRPMHEDGVGGDSCVWFFLGFCSSERSLKFVWELFPQLRRAFTRYKTFIGLETGICCVVICKLV